jgi:hypothetical protein
MRASSWDKLMERKKKLRCTVVQSADGSEERLHEDMRDTTNYI